MKTKIAELKARVSGGVSPAMATPLFANSYRVDVNVVPQMVEFLIDRGVKGLFVGGTTGEGLYLDVDERRKLHEATVNAVNGRIAVILHVGAQRTDTAVALAEHAAGLNPDAIAAVTPYYYGMHDDGLAAYYHTIATAVPDTPLFLYDIPHLAVNSISPGLCSRLSRELPSVAGVKSSNRSVGHVAQLINALPEEKIVLIGNEGVALGLLALGGDGLISGLSTAIPEPFVALTAAVFAGNMAEARRQQQRINTALSFMPAGARIGAIKAILVSRGVPVGSVVPTLPAPPESPWSQQAEALVL